MPMVSLNVSRFQKCRNGCQCVPVSFKLTGIIYEGFM